jgi:hypothetical protein
MRRLTQDVGDATEIVFTPDIRIAIDFGTTFTTVAFIKGGYAKTNDIATVGAFPGQICIGRNGMQVPTEIW